MSAGRVGQANQQVYKRDTEMTLYAIAAIVYHAALAALVAGTVIVGSWEMERE